MFLFYHKKDYMLSHWDNSYGLQESSYQNQSRQIFRSRELLEGRTQIHLAQALHIWVICYNAFNLAHAQLGVLAKCALEEISWGHCLAAVSNTWKKH